MSRTGEQRSTEFVEVDLSGARLEKVHLNNARFRMVDLSGVVMRAVSLSGAAIDADELDDLRINGVEVAPLIEAELTRREPARALRRASDPAGLQEAWAALESSWANTYQRVARMPTAAVEVSVEDEWSFTQTLRHLVFVTDAWLGAIRGDERPFHRWALPFSDLPRLLDEPVDLGIDPDSAPPFPDVIELRSRRVGLVRDFLATVTPEQLAEERKGPVWERQPLTVLTCLQVIINEECEHHRFPQRDLDLIEAGAASR